MRIAHGSTTTAPTTTSTTGAATHAATQKAKPLKARLAKGLTLDYQSQPGSSQGSPQDGEPFLAQLRLSRLCCDEALKPWRPLFLRRLKKKWPRNCQTRSKKPCCCQWKTRHRHSTPSLLRHDQEAAVANAQVLAAALVPQEWSFFLGGGGWWGGVSGKRPVIQGDFSTSLS